MLFIFICFPSKVRIGKFRDKLIFEGALVGFYTGIIVVAFRFLLELLEGWRTGFLDISNKSPYLWFVYILILVFVAFSIRRMVSKEPLIKGSGIPQVQGYLLNILHLDWLNVLIGKFFGALLTIGAGLSLGQEGPAVQLGSCIGKGLGELFGHNKSETQYLVACGVSAGLAAAFNAPLAGVMFTLEEVQKGFSTRVLCSSLVAAVTADFISKRFFGMEPILGFATLEPLPLNMYHYALILGVVMALLGVLFNIVLIRSIKFSDKNKYIKGENKFLPPFIVAGILAATLPEALGSGHHILLDLTKMEWSLGFLMMLLIVKFLFTMICFSSGAPGGTFLPMLALGGIAGAILGNLYIHIFDLPTIYLMNMVVYAMLAYLTAVVRAPITGIILISEMTGTFAHFLPLVMVAIVAYIVADLLGCEPLYESLLERVTMIMPDYACLKNNDMTIEVAVHMGAPVVGKTIGEVDWPEDCHSIKLRRGYRKAMSHKDTIIRAGDAIEISTIETSASRTRKHVMEIAQK